MKPIVSIIIVNWNGRDIINECLDSVFEQGYKNIEVIVVDNNSSDDSISIIKKYNQIKLIQAKENYGFAKGNNIGYEQAKGKYVLLLNSDAFLTKDCLGKLVSHIEVNDQIAIIQPKILYKNNPHFKKIVINSIGAYFTSTGFLNYPGYGKGQTLPQYNKSNEIFSAFGACMLMRKEEIDKVGLFDTDYFAYFEETDFCMRVLLNGKKIYYLSTASAYHRGGVSAKKFGNAKLCFHSFKNRICSYLKNFEGLTLLRILPIHIIICELTAITFLIKGNFLYFRAIQGAIFWNIKNFPKTLKKRQSVQVLRKIPDREYLSIVEKNPRLSYYLYLLVGLEFYND